MEFVKTVLDLFLFKKKHKQERLSNSADLSKLMQWGNFSEVNSSMKY